MMIHRADSVRTTNMTLKSGRRGACRVEVPQANVRDLLCSEWEVIQNPEFSRLSFWPKPRTAKTVDSWLKLLSHLGQDLNLIIHTDTALHAIYRPVCVGKFQGNRLEFCCLPGEPEVIYTDD